jgi:hypothetical protein
MDSGPKLMYIKLPMYLFFIWHLELIFLMGANPLLGPLEGLGPENLEFFGPKNASANGFGWIKSSRPGPTPYKQQVQ